MFIFKYIFSIFLLPLNILILILYYSIFHLYLLIFYNIYYFYSFRIDIEKQTGPEMPMVPLGKRMGTVQEMAKLVGFIASKDNSFMTGQDIVADGGYALYGTGSNSPQ